MITILFVEISPQDRDNKISRPSVSFAINRKQLKPKNY